jgi:hypothetical protein
MARRREKRECRAVVLEPVQALVLDVIKEGGPLLYHCDSEDQLRSFESTCRKFRRFLEQHPS